MFGSNHPPNRQNPHNRTSSPPETRLAALEAKIGGAR